jgi:peptidoglycan-N-acetylglucosamine deacetylase
VDGFGEALEEELEIAVVVDEVDVGGVDDEEIAGGIVEEEVLVSGCDLFDVFVADGAFAGDAFAADALLESVGRGLEVDDELGGGDFGAEHLIVAVVKVEFGVGEIDVGEDLVLLEKIIGDHGGSEVLEITLLLVARHEEPHLGGEGHARLAQVEAVQEGIVLRLDNATGVQGVGQDLGERGLAGADGAFDGDETRLFEEVGHESEKSSEGNTKIPHRQRSVISVQRSAIRSFSPCVSIEALRCGLHCAGRGPLRFEKKQQPSRIHWNFMIAAIASVGAGAILAGGVWAYGSLAPGSQLFGRTIVAGGDAAEFALTFDDGPNDPWTGKLLDVLARHSVRATFFLIGKYVRQRPDLVREIREAGHLIGNHTATHPWLAVKSSRRVRAELAGCNAVVEDVLGQPVHFFRPPHGSRRPDVLRAARELGLTAVMWNAMGFDWRENTTAERIAAHLEKGIGRNQRRGRGSNLLLHDGGHLAMGADRSQSVEATRMILERHAPGKIRYITVDAWA